MHRTQHEWILRQLSEFESDSVSAMQLVAPVLFCPEEGSTEQRIRHKSYATSWNAARWSERFMLTGADWVQVKMTLLLSAVAVPINTVFGVTCAILIARNEFPGKLVMVSMLDLPFSISPVVTGM